MYQSALLLATVFSSVLASPHGASNTGVALGQPCDPKIPDVCAGGADCYAVNSMLIPSCGNFQATCTSDAQCANYLCNKGFCNGMKPSSTPSAPSTPKPTGVNLPLGANCDPAVKDQCANGVSCYAVNSMLIPRCGNFQSTCKTDDQCLNYKCNDGFCNGIISLSNSTTATTVTAVPTGNGASSPSPTGPANNATASQTPSPEITNGGVAVKIAGGSAAFFAVFAATFLL